MAPSQCPACEKRISVRGTFDGRTAVSCPGCGLGVVLDYTCKPEEARREFQSMYKDEQVPDPGSSWALDGLVRRRDEIDAMIGDSEPEKFMLELLRSRKDYIADYRMMKKPPPEMGTAVQDAGLDPRLADVLRAAGISQLYQFQEEAAAAIRGGGDMVIESPTASGKTEAFLLPILQWILEARSDGRRGIRALLVYPTKALARDQLPKVSRYAEAIGVSVNVLDGDTDKLTDSKMAYEPPEILITNFDLIHHRMWRQRALLRQLRSVRFLVVDEAHNYSGIFGSNVYYIIKRIRRFARNVQTVAASATLSNAEEFCGQLFGTQVSLVKGAGRRGEIEFAMVFPSMRSTFDLMRDVTKKLTSKGHRTLVFGSSHRFAEAFAMQLRVEGVDIKVHRSGLPVEYLRSIEMAFRGGTLKAISCTPTMELGVDIGGVDGVVSSSIPVNRLMQRIGRAARKGQKGYAILALGNDPISQYYKNHPDDYFNEEERLFIDPRNALVEEAQVLAMACDRPLTKEEADEHAEVVYEYLKSRAMIEKNGRYAANEKMAGGILRDYSIRGIGKSVEILLNGSKIGERALPMALTELHTDAIYLHGGTKYRVREFDHVENRYAKLVNVPADHSYITRALAREKPIVEEIYERRRSFGIEIAFCRLRIWRSVYGYIKTDQSGSGQPAHKKLDTALSYNMRTKGIVFCAPRPQNTAFSEEAIAGGYHAVEHVIIEGSNMVTGGVSHDLGGISFGASGMIFVYDGTVGGSGASRSLYDRLEAALERSASIVEECPCREVAGCPRCTFSYGCGTNNENLHKAAALDILKAITAGVETKIS